MPQLYTSLILVINTLIHCGNDVEMAKTMLRKMPRPDKLAYSSIINALAKDGKAADADSLLMELNDAANLELKHRHGSLKRRNKVENDTRGRIPLNVPDASTIAAVIHA